jgi:acyl carrier protein
MDKIEFKIQELMGIVFEIPSEEISIESSQDNLDNWDSLRHLDLVTTIEEEFDIEFPIEEIGNLVSFKLIYVILKERIQIEGKTY